MPPAEDPAEAYRRGIAEGAINERLAAHDRSLEMINSQLNQVATRMSELVLQVQRVADQTVAGTERQREVATAIKEATAHRLAMDAQGWSPWAKTLAVLGGLAAMATVVATVVLMFGQ